MATAVATRAEKVARKSVSIPVSQDNELVTLSLSFTPAQWAVILDAVECEASSWRVVVSNADTREFYSKVDARRNAKGLDDRQREVVGRYIFTGGKAKKQRALIGPTAVVKHFATLKNAGKKIAEALKVTE
jgi:hypothetical protein